MLGSYIVFLNLMELFTVLGEKRLAQVKWLGGKGLHFNQILNYMVDGFIYACSEICTHQKEYVHVYQYPYSLKIQRLSCICSRLWVLGSCLNNCSICCWKSLDCAKQIFPLF